MKKLFTTFTLLAFGAVSAHAERVSPPLLAKSVASASTQFGFSLFQTQTAKKSNENVLVSPLSASLALHMAQNGAKGATLTEIATALGVPTVKLNHLNMGVENLMKQLTSGKTEEKVAIANSLWADSNRFTFNDIYLGQVQEAFGAALRQEPFNDPKTVVNINDWVKEKTEGMIPKLLEKLSADSVAVLLNALYFKGTWLEPFSKHLVSKADFTDAEGNKKKVDMMNQGDARIDYAENDQVQVASLGFKRSTSQRGQGEGDYRVDFILPKDDKSLKDVAAALSGKEYQELVAKLDSQIVELSIPKFKFDTKGSLKPALEALGVKDAFSDAADLTALGRTKTNDHLFIEDVIQATAVEVDENGFKAAAATAVIIGAESAAPRPSVTFKADRPFLFVLRHKETGAVLFIGQYVKP